MFHHVQSSYPTKTIHRIENNGILDVNSRNIQLGDTELEESAPSILCLGLLKTTLERPSSPFGYTKFGCQVSIKAVVSLGDSENINPVLPKFILQ